MKTIKVDGKEYECKRYTYEELEKFFNGKVVIVKDENMKNCQVIDGVLVAVCNIDERDKIIEKLAADGISHAVLYFTQPPLFASYGGIAYEV